MGHSTNFVRVIDGTFVNVERIVSVREQATEFQTLIAIRLVSGEVVTIQGRTLDEVMESICRPDPLDQMYAG